jgi:hypothetical protein
MSTRYQVILTCDVTGCSSEVRCEVSNANLARHEARERHGWTHQNGKDLCAEHNTLYNIADAWRGVKFGGGQ